MNYRGSVLLVLLVNLILGLIDLFDSFIKCCLASEIMYNLAVISATQIQENIHSYTLIVT